MTPDAFLQSARSLIGTKYAHQGRSSRTVDCVGLVIVALQMGGILTNEEAAAIPGDYPRQPNGALPAQLHAHCVRVQTEDVQPGDLLALKYHAEPQHLVIVERINAFGMMVIHAVPDGGVIAHRIDESYLQQRRATIHAVFRLKKFIG